MSRATLVYIAGPISKDPFNGTRNAIHAADALMDRGYAPFVPHLSVFWEIVSHHAYEDWMKLDFAFLFVCDVVLRLPGESPGADREVEFAKRHGIPVEYSLDSLCAIHPATRTC